MTMGNARVIGYGLVIAISITFASAQAPSTQTPQATFAATSAHVAQPGSPVNIKIFRWSSDEERAPLMAALNAPPPPPPPSPPPPAAPAPPAPAPEGDAAAAQAGRAGRAGRAGGRGGRGDTPPPPPKPITPVEALTNAITKAPTIGYIWTDEVTGYSIKYAQRFPLQGGGERIILATSRRLGMYTTAWTPVPATAAKDLAFSLIELRVNAKGTGEGKASLTTGVVVDSEAKTIALENYAGAPVVLQNVKR